LPDDDARRDNRKIAAGKNMPEQGIMISHTATESYLAQAWQDLIHDVFDFPRDRIWFSSDPDALDAGPFATQIESQIKGSLAVISIQSPVSRFRPWTLWEAGIARGLDKPIYVVVYEKPGTTKERSIFSNLGTPLDALQHFRGTDIVKVKGVLDRLCERLGCTLVATRLESALANYKKTVEFRQDCWFWDQTIFDKRIQLVFTTEECRGVLQNAAIAGSVKVRDVEGSLCLFGLKTDEIPWDDFTSNLKTLELPWEGSAERWARGLGITFQRALRGRLVGDAEGLPLYFDAAQKKTYRPSVSLEENHGCETIFTVNFTLIPPELSVNSRSPAGILVHHLDLCRMWRWGVLEDYEIASFFRNLRSYSEQESTELICDFLEKCFSVRTEFLNRGLQKDSIRYAIEANDLPILDDILRRYYTAMRTIDPSDRGILPKPLPEYKILQQIYSELLKVNKEYYELIYRNFGRELKKLSESIC
jgi:hypothetical protein